MGLRAPAVRVGDRPAGNRYDARRAEEAGSGRRKWSRIGGATVRSDLIESLPPAAGAPPAVLTVGHSTRPLDDFLALLAAHRVEALVDVRRFPGSRRHPQYSRDALAAALAAAGIAYRHDPRLGGRRPPRPDSPHTAWRNPSFRAYADHMDSSEFRAALAELAAASATRRTVVMCAEAVPWRCHRRLIADALTATGREVLHLLSATRADLHHLHEDAEVLPDGRLLYRAPGDRQRGLFESE